MKKVYNIQGFDCANCAAKTESFLNHDSRINYARIDFAGSRLYITYKDKELSIEELKKLIKQIESNDLVITDIKESIKQEKIFSRNNIILLSRIIISLILMLIGRFLYRDAQGDWPCTIFYGIAILIIGYDIFKRVAYKIIKLRNPIDEYFLVAVSVIGVTVLSIIKYTLHDEEAFESFFDGTMVIVLFQIGQFIEHIVSIRSRNAISTAVDLRGEYANLFDGENETKIESKKLKVDDLIIVRVGDTIPVDSIVIDGEGSLDVSSLTGEYVPKKVRVNDETLSGCTLKSGSLILQVKKIYSESTVSKILELVASSGEHKAKAENFISKFAKVYTPAVIFISMLLLLIFGLTTHNWIDATTKALYSIVIACPCAIIISVPLSYFAGIGLASKNGILIKGANYLDELCKLKKLVSDKTGTLTHGSFMISKINPINISIDEFKDYIYAIECNSNHPIAKAILHDVSYKGYINKVSNYEEVAGKGVIVNYKNNSLIGGSKSFLKEHNIEAIDASEIGTIVHLGVNNKYCGYLVLSDEIKKDAQPMVNLLHFAGIEIVLLTGDKEEVASSTCKELGIDRWHSELLPSDKEKYLELEMNDKNKKVAFIGDGINDAPSIIRSDIGIAMGGIGSDIAVKNADVVIMNDNPAKVYDAHKIAKMSRNRAYLCICISLLVKIIVLILDWVAPDKGTLRDLIPTVAVFADTGLTVLMILLASSLLYQKVRRPKNI